MTLALFRTFLDRMVVKLGSVILSEKHRMRGSKVDIWGKMGELMWTGEDCRKGCTPHQIGAGIAQSV